MMRAFLIAVAVVAADQIAKTQAIAPARNAGVIMGATPISGLTLLAVTVLVLIAFLAVVGRWAVQIGLTPIAPALIASGMFAHTLDRLRFGGVRDFVSTPLLLVDVADFAVVAGIVMLAIAFGWRTLALRASSQRIALELPTLRAVVKEA